MKSIKSTMKIVLKISLVLVVLIAIGFYFLLRGLGPSDPARLAPSDAVAFFCVPDTWQSARRWNETSLFKISQEPAMREFLRKPLDRMATQGGEEAVDVLRKLRPARFFGICVKSEATSYAWYAGVQFFGGKESAQDGLKYLRKLLSESMGGSLETPLTAYHGTEIVRSDHAGFSLYTAIEGKWCLLSTEEATLHAALDRVAGRIKTPSLAENGDYQASLARLPKDPDFLSYVDPKPFLETLIAVGKSKGAQVIPAQVDQLQKIKTITFGGKMEGKNFRDAFFVQYDTASHDPSTSLTHKGMQFASPDSLVYLSTTTDFKKNIRAWFGDSAVLSLDQKLDSIGSSVSELIASLEPEISLSAGWPDGTMIPTALAVVPLKDATSAKKWFDSLSATFPGMQPSGDGAVTYYAIPISSPFFHPVIALSNAFLFMGIDQTYLADKITGGLHSSLADTDVFQSVHKFYDQNNESFVFINTQQLFDRAYAQVQPVLAFGAMLTPGIAEWVEISKLPPSSVVSSHLDPIVFTVSPQSNGTLVESQGPVTLQQIFVLSGIGYFLNHISMF